MSQNRGGSPKRAWGPKNSGGILSSVNPRRLNPGPETRPAAEPPTAPEPPKAGEPQAAAAPKKTGGPDGIGPVQKENTHPRRKGRAPARGAAEAKTPGLSPAANRGLSPPWSPNLNRLPAPKKDRPAQTGYSRSRKNPHPNRERFEPQPEAAPDVKNPGL